MNHLKHQAGNLLEVTARLASPPEKQLAYLRQLGVAPAVDELALEFDDMYKPVDVLRLEVVLTDLLRADRADPGHWAYVRRAGGSVWRYLNGARAT